LGDNKIEGKTPGAEQPEGRYTVETKLTIDLGVNTDRSFQKAGVVVFINDDHHLRLTLVAIFTTRQTEFLKEMPFADGISSGSMSIGPPADDTWLRISHRRDPVNREHEFRAATSRDGKKWVWGGVWTLPADTTPRIGLVSMGGSGATAEFDYLRVYRP
jgi:arabinan endo-1,5-alpha-L-arabinosidase